MATIPLPDDGLERLSDSIEFAAELERLAALAPEPWATKLRAILDEQQREGLLMPVSEASKVRLGFDEHSARARRPR